MKKYLSPGSLVDLIEHLIVSRVLENKFPIQCRYNQSCRATSKLPLQSLLPPTIQASPYFVNLIVLGTSLKDKEGDRVWSCWRFSTGAPNGRMRKLRSNSTVAKGNQRPQMNEKCDRTTRDHTCKLVITG